MTLVRDPRTGSTILTTQTETRSAHVRVGGHLDIETARALEGEVEQHLRAGRRYLRIDILGVRSVDDTAVAVLGRLHGRLLSVRGTMIITGVVPSVMAALAAADPSLLMLAPTAAELGAYELGGHRSVGAGGSTFGPWSARA